MLYNNILIRLYIRIFGVDIIAKYSLHKAHKCFNNNDIIDILLSVRRDMIRIIYIPFAVLNVNNNYWYILFIVIRNNNNVII